MTRFSVIIWGGIVIVPLICEVATAGDRLQYPRSPTACIPGGAGFGYYITTWRQWPGEKRLDQINPQAIGREVITTPDGQEQVPTPPNGVPPQPSPPVPEGGVLPSPGPAGQGRPRPTITMPEEKGLGLPGLPAEPNAPPAALPEAPLNMPPAVTPTPKKNILPEKDKQPTSQPKKEDRQGSGVYQQHNHLTTASSYPYESPYQSFQQQPAVSNGSVISLAGNEAYSAPAKVEQTSYSVEQPRIALNGFCPVELAKNGRWTPGDLQFTVVHQGLIYRFAGPTQRQEFLANPAMFAPAYGGNDAVLMVEQNRTVPGQVEYCATYNGRIYMFSNATNQMRFAQNPQRYALEK